jgi:membrane protease subunit HflK
MADTYNIKKPKASPVLIIIIIVIVLLIIVGLNSVYRIEASDSGIMLRFGKKVGNNIPPGLHLKIPFVDEVIAVTVRKVETEEFGFRTIEARADKTIYADKSQYEVESRMLTGDLNIADVEWVVQYQIKDPYEYVFKIDDAEKTLRDLSESIMRRFIGDMELLKEIVTTDIGATGELQQRLKEQLQISLNNLESGIEITDVYIQDLTHAYETRVTEAFSNVITAEQVQKKIIEEAEEKRKKAVEEIDGEYRQRIEEAEGYKAERINEAKGNIAKFVALYDQYKLYPEITKKRMYIETITKLYKKLDKVTIIDGDVLKNTLPLFDIKGGGY